MGGELGIERTRTGVGGETLLNYRIGDGVSMSEVLGEDGGARLVCDESGSRVSSGRNPAYLSMCSLCTHVQLNGRVNGTYPLAQHRDPPSPKESQQCSPWAER